MFIIHLNILHQFIIKPYNLKKTTGNLYTSYERGKDVDFPGRHAAATAFKSVAGRKREKFLQLLDNSLSNNYQFLSIILTTGINFHYL